MPKIKIEHIDALSRGKKSGIRIGSRAVPHHLYAYEREEYARALKRGYLIVDERSRVNLSNLWLLVCQSRAISSIIVEKSQKSARVLVADVEVFIGDLALAKRHAAQLVQKREWV